MPTRGMERWLTQRLSDRLGVCANVDFPFPRTLAGNAVAAATGVDPAEDPWLPERMVWPLLEVVDAALDEPWLAGLAAHVRRGHRFPAVRHLAELFDRYALLRPDMVRSWAGGDPVDGDAAWQAELWRRLRERIGRPGPAERLADALDRLRAEPGIVALPPRLSLFGLTRLPAGHLDVLRALAAARDVHLFLLHPSPALWERVAGHPPVTRRADGPDRRSRAATACSPPGARTRASSSSSSARAPPTTITRSRRRPRRCSAASRPTCARTAAAPGPPLPGERDERRCLPRATAASRSTRATAAPARSRWCATRSCTCSRRTRRSSRAT